jgi:hypothetical protein
MYAGEADLLAFGEIPPTDLYTDIYGFGPTRSSNFNFSATKGSNFVIIYGHRSYSANQRVLCVEMPGDGLFRDVQWVNLISKQIFKKLPFNLDLSRAFDPFHQVKKWPAFLKALSALNEKFNIEMYGMYVGSVGILPLTSLDGSPYKLELRFESIEVLERFEVILKDVFSQAEFVDA